MAFAKKAWILAADMGHGHQRAAAPLFPIALEEKILTANNYPGIPDSDRKIWQRTESFYGWISRLHESGPLGRAAFGIFDQFQKIENFYPETKRTKPNFQLRQTYSLIKKGWGRHLIETLSAKPVPLVTTFFTAAFMAEHWRYPGPIFAVVTDSDVARAWAPLEPEKTIIRYFAPTERVVRRLMSYGVPERNIIQTGFTLPTELIGENMETAKRNLGRRLAALDPRGLYRKKYKALIEQYVGAIKPGHGTPVSLAFVIGGAGAQSDIGIKILKSLKELLERGEIKLTFLLGTHENLVAKFKNALNKFGLIGELNRGVFIVYAQTKDEYFKLFNKALESTDILWSKPSELSFFAALGMPLIIAPPIGSQEVQNRDWLLSNYAAIDQLDPRYTHEWLPDFIKTGRLAESALESFIRLEKNGTDHIINYLNHLP